MNQRLNLKVRLLTFLAFLFQFALAALAFAENPAVPAGSSAAPSASPPPGPSGIMGFAPFIIIFAIFYFMLIRPQQKRVKEQQAMLAALKHGDEVITSSGMLGKITGITDKVVTVEVADQVRVKMLKTQISQVVKGSIKDAI